jgi:uncharacterized protein
MAGSPDFEKARDYALSRLARELSPNLTYHCLGHTRDEVIPAVDQLATLEKVGDKDRLLLLTAAYFHDLGFIRQRQDHEMVSIQIAEQKLPEFGYSNSDIAVIKGIIQATHLPQSPTTLLEKIMADADMDDLGNGDFWTRSRDLRQELENYGIKYTEEEWYSDQLRLMQVHQYFTNSQKALRDAVKQQHMQEVKRLLDQALKLNAS